MKINAASNRTRMIAGCAVAAAIVAFASWRAWGVRQYDANFAEWQAQIGQVQKQMDCDRYAATWGGKYSDASGGGIGKAAEALMASCRDALKSNGFKPAQ